MVELGPHALVRQALKDVVLHIPVNYCALEVPVEQDLRFDWCKTRFLGELYSIARIWETTESSDM
jgi:hypothetical protein